MAGFTPQSFLAVKRKINKELKDRRVAALYALAQAYAAKAEQDFMKRQGNEEFWTNQSFQAFSRVFARAFKDGNDVGFFIAHGVEYGVYLELANDREREALAPIVRKFAPLFFRDAQRIMKG